MKNQISNIFWLLLTNMSNYPRANFRSSWPKIGRFELLGKFFFSPSQKFSAQLYFLRPLQRLNRLNSYFYCKWGNLKANLGPCRTYARFDFFYAVVPSTKHKKSIFCVFEYQTSKSPEIPFITRANLGGTQNFDSYFSLPFFFVWGSQH